MTNYDSSEQIIQKLKDKCFPSLILLDGNWGCGKTYHARQELTPRLKREFKLDISYMSLQGVSSIDDFRNRILSLHYSGKTNGVKLINSVKNIISKSGRLIGDSGLTEGTLNAFSEPLKHHFLSNIDHRVFILDDLERVYEDKLRIEILGECLSLVESKQNIYIVVIADSTKIENKNILEKVFGESVSLTLSPNDIIKFVESEYQQSINGYIISELKLLLSQLEVNNLRIIKRIFQLFSKVKYKIEQDSNIDQQLALIMMMRQITCICCAHYQYGYNIDEISNPPKIVSENFKNMIKKDNFNVIKEEKEDENRNDLLYKIITHSNSKISTAIIKFCFHQAEIPHNFIYEFQLPLNNTIIDRMISYNTFGLKQDEWDTINVVSEKYLFNENIKQYYNWFRVLDHYLFLIKNKYINGNYNTVLTRAKKIALIPNNFEDIGDITRHSMSSFLEIEDIKKIHIELRPKIQCFYNDKRLIKLEENFINSWKSVEDEIYSKYDSRPFLHSFNVKNIIEGIKEWPISDTIYFGQYISNRYSVNNAYETISDEFKFVEEMASEIKKYLEDASPSKSTGLLVELNHYLQQALEHIQKNNTSIAKT